VPVGLYVVGNAVGRQLAELGPGEIELTAVLCSEVPFEAIDQSPDG